MTGPMATRPRQLPPFPAELAGTVELVGVESRRLAGNPLGDPSRRQVAIYRPPDGRTEGRPLLVYLAGYTGRGRSYVQAPAYLREDLLGLVDRLIRAGEIAPMSLLLPDCLTSLGGSQYVDSPATGPYASYLLDELLPSSVERLRSSILGVMGQSSGGFGALHLAMERPGMFAAVGSSAGDVAFELTYAPSFPKAARCLQSEGGVDELLRKIAGSPQLVSNPNDPAAAALMLIAMSACYSPSGTAGGFDLPFDLATGAIVPDVWARWMALDPVVRLGVDADRAALRRLRSLHLTASRSDEWFLDLAARRFVERARAVGVPVRHEEFEGGHFQSLPRLEAILRTMSATLGSAAGPHSAGPG